MGRKRKSGQRTKSGRLSRAAQFTHDKGTERAQAMRALYGENWADPIGRAYEAGLLGSGNEAKNLLDTARSIHVAYWSAYVEQPIRCTLADRTFGNVIDIDHKRVKRREEWLNSVLDIAKKMGVRRQFDQLVVDVNPDHGPDWLDRVIYDHRRRGPEHNDTATPADHAHFRAALDALETIAGY